MSKKIILLDYKYPAELLHDVEIDLELLSQYRMLTEHGVLFGAFTSFPRNNRLKAFSTGFNTAIPDLSKFSTVSFSEATDQRANELSNELCRHDLPIVVHWSGGIDSTVIVSAIYKNFSPVLKERVIVVLNQSSYLENPFFFENVIKPSFRYTSNVDGLNYTSSIILNGDPADPLWIQGNILKAAKHANVTSDNVHHDPSNILNLFKNTNKGSGLTDQQAEWALDFLIKNAKISNIDLVTTSDVMWWANFVMEFETMCNKRLYTKGLSLEDMSVDRINLYYQNFKPWYLSDLYQVWSMQAQLEKTKFDGSQRSYKMAAKEYIYEVDKNIYYRDYKSKVRSVAGHDPRLPHPYVIYSDGTVHIDRNTKKFLHHA